MSDGEAVLHGKMYGIFVRCILAMSYGEMESNFGDVAEGAGVGCFKGG